MSVQVNQQDADRTMILVVVGSLVAMAGLLSLLPNLENDALSYDLISLPLVVGPVVFGLLLLGVGNSNLARILAFVYGMFMLTLTTLMFFEHGDDGWEGLAFNTFFQEHSYVWMETLGIEWHVGMDGLSFPMVWLTTFLIPVTSLMTWDEKSAGRYHATLLITGGVLIGVFVALDLFMFYVFWELTLIPMFFLILLWGGEDRRYAAQKFFIYTFTASVIMLLAILTMYFLMPAGGYGNAGTLTGRTFDIQQITNAALNGNSNGVWLGLEMQKALFLMMMLGFLVKLPAVPFHTWLPDAHVQAPTGGSMLLAGVMLKMGAYGMFRLPVTLFPHALSEYQDLLMIVGMVALVWGAFVCLGQTNLKKMIAYSSVSHMGIIVLGIATMQPLGYAAALFMMFAHGIISPMLFAVCGAFKHHYHSMEIGDMRGMARYSPFLAVYMMFAWMASLGLPLLAGFVAELMLIVAFWHAYGWWTLLPGLVLVITAAYYLWSMQRTIFEGGDEGQPPESLHGETPPDLSSHEKIAMFILAVATVLFGVLPFIALDMMNYWTTEVFTSVIIPALGGA